MLITLSRQFAAGGSRVATLVAEDLGWRVVDNDLIDRVAERAGMTSEEVARREERPPSFVERLARLAAVQLPDLFVPVSGPLPALDEEHLVHITGSLVSELAAAGRCVIVGRASAAVLARESDTLHARLVAPKEWRVQRAIEHLGLDPAMAERRLEEVDANRARYHRDYYQRDSGDPINYDLVLNSARLGVEGAAAVIVGRARALGWS